MTALLDHRTASKAAIATLLVFGGFGAISGVCVYGGLAGGVGGMLVFPVFAALGFALLPYQTIGLMLALAVMPGIVSGLAALAVRSRSRFPHYAAAAVAAGCAAEALAVWMLDLPEPGRFVGTAAITAALCAALTWRLDDA